MNKIIDTLILAGLLKVTETHDEVLITLSIPLTSQPTMPRIKSPKLGRDQRLVLQIAHDLCADRVIVSTEGLYDAVRAQLPPPPQGKRDRRSELIQRAMRTLHEKGFIVIYDGIVNLGSAFKEKEIPASEV